MAIRRTKKQKQAATEKRVSGHTFSLAEIDTVSPKKAKPVKENLALSDPQLIVGDLKRTLIVSGLILGLLTVAGVLLR